MTTPQSQWKLFFIEKAGGEKVPVVFTEGNFRETIRKHRPSVDGSLVFQRIILLLLLETPEQRSRYPVMEDDYPKYAWYQKCRAGFKVRIFFLVQEKNHTLTFGVKHKNTFRRRKKS